VIFNLFDPALSYSKFVRIAIKEFENEFEEMQSGFFGEDKKYFLTLYFVEYIECRS